MVLQNQLMWFDLLLMLCLMHTERLLIFTSRAHCWLTCNLVSTRTTSSFSAGLVPSLYWYRVIPSLVQDMAFSVVELHKGSVSSFLHPDKVLLMAAQPSGEQNTPPSFVLSAIQSCLVLRRLVALVTSIKTTDSRK